MARRDILLKEEMRSVSLTKNMNYIHLSESVGGCTVVRVSSLIFKVLEGH